MTLAARIAIPSAIPAPSTNFSAAPIAARTQGTSRPNTAAMLARIVIGSLALSATPAATVLAQGDQHLSPTIVTGVPFDEDWYLWRDRTWGWYDTNYTDTFNTNPGDIQADLSARVPDCPGTDGDNPGSGNPVVLATGNKIETERDFTGTGPYGLFLERTYNFLWKHYGLFGKHWLTNFDYSLSLDLDDGWIWAQRPDGRRILFRRSA